MRSTHELEPLPGLAPELAGLDHELARAYLAERVLLPTGLVNQALLRLPNPASTFMRLTRWAAGVVLAGGMVGVYLLYHIVAGPARSAEWTMEEQWGYSAGAVAIVLALVLSMAAPRLAAWIRAGVRRLVQTPTAPLAAEVLAWRVGAMALLVGVWFALR